MDYFGMRAISELRAIGRTESKVHEPFDPSVSIKRTWLLYNSQWKLVYLSGDFYYLRFINTTLLPDQLANTLLRLSKVLFAGIIDWLIHSELSDFFL